MRYSIPLISLPCAVALVLLGGCDQTPHHAEDGPRPVKFMVVRSTQPVGLRVPGIVQARIETDHAFRTLGRIVSRKVEVGDIVTKGDVLAELDPVALKLAVTSAEADLRNAQAQLENAALTENRYRTLVSANAGSAADYELAEQGLKSARSSVAKAQASLDKARDQLGYAHLKAELSGVVTSISAETGQVVTAGQTVLQVAQLGQSDAVVDVPETQIGGLALGARFEVVLQLDNSIRTVGVLREIGPEADASTRSHRLKLAIDDAPEVFRLGSIVTVTTVAGDRPPPMIDVPASAVLDRDGARHVWVIDPAAQTVALRTVRTAGTVAGSVRIADGLRDGETIATAGVNGLGDGQKIRIEKGPRP